MRQADRYPLQNVLRSRMYTTRNHPLGCWSYDITLVCGHHVHRKGSQGVPKRARCMECHHEHQEWSRKAQQSLNEAMDLRGEP